MLKCFVLILSLFVGFQAQAQGNTTSALIRGQVAKKDNLAAAYLSKNGNMIDQRGKAVVSNEKSSFKLKSRRTAGGAIDDKVEKGNAVEVNCISPSSPTKWGKIIGTKMTGEVEKIKRKGSYDFVKVKGCDYFVQSHHVASKLQNQLPPKVISNSNSVAQRGAQ